MRVTGARGFISLSLTRRFRIIGLISTVPCITVPAATAPPSPPLARPQPQPTGVPNPTFGKSAGTTPAHHAAQASANTLKHLAIPPRPLQIIDKPIYLYGRFHPPRQRDDLLVLRMMCQQRINNAPCWESHLADKPHSRHATRIGRIFLQIGERIAMRDEIFVLLIALCREGIG